MHLVFSDRACFVGGYDGNSSQSLRSTQTLHYRAFSGQGITADAQHHRDDDGEFFRNNNERESKSIEHGLSGLGSDPRMELERWNEDGEEDRDPDQRLGKLLHS